MGLILRMRASLTYSVSVHYTRSFFRLSPLPDHFDKRTKKLASSAIPAGIEQSRNDNLPIIAT